MDEYIDNRITDWFSQVSWLLDLQPVNTWLTHVNDKDIFKQFIWDQVTNNNKL